MKSIILSYLLAVMGLVTPIAGLHRFYLGKPFSGLFYLCTWGFFGIGTVIDLVRMPFLVDNTNIKFLLRQNIYKNIYSPPIQKFSNPDRMILRLAQENNGVITAPMVTMNTNLNLNEANNHLNHLYKTGFCKKDIDEDGIEIFIFQGLTAKNPLF